MTTEHFIAEALQLPVTAIGYHVSRRLRTLYPDKTLLEGGDQFFNMEEYARTGHCTLTEKAAPISQRVTYWLGSGSRLLHRAHQTWFEVAWQGERLDVLILHFGDGMSNPYHYYILADHADVAERFLCAVCDWNMELRDEVLVFEGGSWHKDAELFAAIKGATLDNLVLRGSLKEEISADLATFFAARDTYATYGVPWKRGILFVGPAGNGKTHAVKALVNALGQPCLYVKSFHTQMPDEYSIRAVFERARASAPCILVLEDLDSLVTPTNRSFFLNELDGFAGNAGILTLATTNHPERLDPAIIDRPSRFDRKYPFDLPAVEERRVYIAQWNASLQPALRLSEAAAAQIAEQTEGFSFAYLKELFLSAMMRWIATAQPGTMEQVMGEQVGVLREQMVSTALLPPIEPGSEGEGGVFPQRGWMRWGPPAHVVLHPPHGGDDVPL
jgi:hypothetical protein